MAPHGLPWVSRSSLCHANVGMNRGAKTPEGRTSEVRFHALVILPLNFVNHKHWGQTSSMQLRNSYLTQASS